MKKVFALIFVLSSVHLGFSQQVPQYTQWSWHQLALNPAHSGIKKCIDIHTLARTQWVGFEGAPKTGFLTVSVPLNSKRKKYLSARHGLGFKFEKDAIGQFSMNRLNFSYAGHFNFNKTDRLSLGVYGGVIQMGYDPSTTTTSVPDAVALNQGSFIAPDASFGAWYNSTNYYAGLVLQQLIPNDWGDIGENSRNRIHSLLYGGYRFGINQDVSLLPTALLKISPKGPASVDLNMMFDYKNFLTFGLGYRSTDALLASFQIKFQEQFAIGYSFDYTLSRIQSGAKNTHEISLRYTTCKPERNSTYSCPLFD